MYTLFSQWIPLTLAPYFKKNYIKCHQTDLLFSFYDKKAALHCSLNVPLSVTVFMWHSQWTYWKQTGWNVSTTSWYFIVKKKEKTVNAKTVKKKNPTGQSRKYDKHEEEVMSRNAPGSMIGPDGPTISAASGPPTQFFLLPCGVHSHYLSCVSPQTEDCVLKLVSRHGCALKPRGWVWER